MIGKTFQFAWEVRLIEWLQTNLPTFVINAFDKVSIVGDTIFMVTMVAFVYLCYDKKKGKVIFVNAVMSLMSCALLKNVLLRRRPYFDNKNIKCLKVVDKNYDMYDIRKQGFSFPSMHSSNTTTIFGSIYRCFKKNVYLLMSIVFSLIVGISRFVLGCHYPTDVLVGWLFGALSVIVFSKLQERLERKYFNIMAIVIMLIGSTFSTSSDFYAACGIYLGYIACEYVDKKYIHFENTRNIIRIVTRLILAGGVFFLVSNLLKMPFSEDILEANNTLGFALRTLRYALSTFISIGLTPLLYKYNLLKINDSPQ